VNLLSNYQSQLRAKRLTYSQRFFRNLHT
jgi:hypothetical protein